MEERKNNNTGLLVLVIILVMLVLGMGLFIIYDKLINKTNEPNIEETDQNETNIKESFSVDNKLLEVAVKQALIENVGKKEMPAALDYDNAVWAEGHKTLGFEIKDEKIYVYVTAEILTYIQTNGKYADESGIAGPFVLVFTKEYDFVEYLAPANGEGYEKTLKTLFPSNLVDEATSVDYRVDFYQNQIKEYLNK